MNPDVLEQALRAYRVDSTQGGDRAAETLGRILGSQRGHRPLRFVVWTVILTCSAAAAAAIYEAPQIRAVLAGRTAALASGDTAPEVAAAAAAVEPGPATPPPLPIVGSSGSSTAPQASAPVPAVAARTHRGVPARPRAPVRVADRNAEESRGPSDPEDALFEEVQRDHRSASSSEDLAGWQRYLAAYPEGRFAPEARYRRAEALARLGDENAAIAAFMWFARNPDGSSRREDALRWIRALTAER